MLTDEQLAEAKAAFQRWSEHNPHWTDPMLAFLAGWQLGSDPITYDGVDTEPKDRVARLCEVAAKAIRSHPEGGKGLKLVVMIEADEGGAAEISGYRDSAEAVADLINQALLMAKAHGLNDSELFRRILSRPTSTAPKAFKQRR